MSTILLILSTAVVTWSVLYELLYSPKARIRALQKEIFRIAHEMNKHNTGDSVVDSIMKAPYEKVIQKRWEMIDALLVYHFDPEVDQEYIEENKSGAQKLN